MSAFDQAWAIVKADTGMWEEIYAPLLAQTTGMGELSSARHFTDFVPTNFAREKLFITDNSLLNPTELAEKEFFESLMRNKGDHKYSVDMLVDSILEEGYDPKRFRTNRMDPSFEVNTQGMDAFEGRHRLLALDKLGAPYVPYSGKFLNSPYTGRDHPHTYPIGREFLRDTSTPTLGGNASPWSIGGYMRRGTIPFPISYFYGREMTPGMGRLLPDGGGRDIMEEDDDLNEDWLHDGTKRSWKVVHDD